MGNPDLYRVLNEVVPLDECEVYSWFPEPEYDPHTQPEDGEVSDGGYEFDEDVFRAGWTWMKMGMDPSAGVKQGWN
jgi:hypothetical protein